MPSLDDLRPGEVVAVNAIVLGNQAFKENDKLVRLLTLEFGKISTFAVNAQKSIKRFGASVEPMNFVKAQIKVPRNVADNDSPLFRLERADLRSSFPHLRQSYAAIDTASFALRMVGDFLPELAADESLFKF
jgi:DNA repair protein RecO